MAGGGFGAFLALFSLLFVASGVGNGAVFQLIPAVFIADRAAVARRRRPTASARALREGTLEGAAALGLASAIAAFGGFFIPKAYGTAIALTGGTAAALYPFFVFYALLHRGHLVVLRAPQPEVARDRTAAAQRIVPCHSSPSHGSTP